MRCLLSALVLLAVLANTVATQQANPEITKTSGRWVIQQDPAVSLLDADLPSYVPQPVVLPPQAGYLLPDGSIAVVGYNDMDAMLANLNVLFTRSHPGFKFTMRLKGTATAAPALTHGVSAFAPMGTEFSTIELVTYRSLVGAEPLLIRVAHCAVNPRARSAPLGIYINKANPLDRLTVAQVARIFSTGSSGGDLTSWGQLGLQGEWANRAIHPYGIHEEATAGLAPSMLRVTGGLPFPFGYESFPQSVDVVKRVGEDLGGIGFASGNNPAPEVKLLMIAEQDGGHYVPLTAAEVVSGKYPLDLFLLIYLRRVPGQPLDPLAKEYLRLVLSKEGQQAIAGAAPGYLPLNAREVREELAKLE